VCGGGIAGLVAALCLEREGFACAVYEAHDERRATTSAINLAPSGVRVLAALGVADSIAARSATMRYMRMLASDGSVRAELAVAGREQYGYDARAMTRRVLHDALIGVARQRRIPLHFGARLVSVRQSACHVEARFDDGRAMVRGAMLIGADGIHSAVRASILPGGATMSDGSARYYGCGALVPLRCLSDDERRLLRLGEGGMNLASNDDGSFAGFIAIGAPDDDREEKFLFWTHIALDDGVELDTRDMTQVKQFLRARHAAWFAPVRKVIELLDTDDVEAMCASVSSLPPIERWSCERVQTIFVTSSLVKNTKKIGCVDW
jgi:2-polyprenyl-6-methoxyphenol hydroxylase-like FAD-dependent oxidoreductase